MGRPNHLGGKVIMRTFKTQFILFQIFSVLFAVQGLATFVPSHVTTSIPDEDTVSVVKPQLPYPLGKTRIDPQGVSRYYIPKQKDLRYLDYRGYYSIYDTEVNTPLLTVEHLDGTLSSSSMARVNASRRRYDKFKSDSRLIALERVNHKSYNDVTRRFSRGHLTPCGDFDDRDLKVQTFMTTNIAPQVQETFNDGLWSELESQVRNLADHSTGLTVITGVVHDQKRKLNGKISIPSHFYKIIIRDDQSPMGISAVSAFLMQNRRYSKAEMNVCDYQVPVKKIEELTGMNFLISIPPEIREEMIQEVGQLHGLCF